MDIAPPPWVRARVRSEPASSRTLVAREPRRPTCTTSVWERATFGSRPSGWERGPTGGDAAAPAATETIHRALELGINLFDTAQAYGFGEAERVLAGALWGQVKREDVVVATKGGLRMEGTRVVRDASPSWLREGVEQSLSHLQTDYLDLFQIHWPDPRTPLQETAAALAGLVEEDKVRHVGVSNFGAEQLAELGRFVEVETLQPPYHLFRREVEVDVLPYCAAHDIGVLAYGPLAHGLLSGTMTVETTFPPGDWRSHSPDFTGDRFAANLAVVDQLEAFAAGRGISLVELAVAWTLAHPAVDTALVGARHPEHPVRGPAPEGM
jgi:aryl-alcohol dehydrogenase-like predicted oxidoreductase